MRVHLTIAAGFCIFLAVLSLPAAYPQDSVGEPAEVVEQPEQQLKKLKVDLQAATVGVGDQQQILLVGLCNLGDIHGGDFLSFDVAMTHDLEKPVFIDRIAKSCNCLSAQVLAGEWGPGEFGARTVRVSLSAPKRKLAATERLGEIEFRNKSGVVAKLNIVANLISPLVFADEYSAVSVPAETLSGKLQFELPMKVHAQTNLEQLKWSVPNWVSITLLKSDSLESDFLNEYRALVRVPAARALKESSLTISCTYDDEKRLGYSISTQVRFVDPNSLEFYPNTILVGRDKSSDFLVVSRAGDVVGRIKALKAMLEGKPVPIKVIVLGDNAARIYLTLPNEFSLESPLIVTGEFGERKLRFGAD